MAEPHDAQIDIKPAVVRIKQQEEDSGGNDVTAGAGFLVDARTVITCAHVVEAALCRPGMTDPPDDLIVIEFAFCKPRQDIMARVVRWSPVEANDVAVLEVAGRPPVTASPIHLTPVEDGVLLQHGFYACGFPDGPQGKWIQGTLISPVGNRWIQLQDDHSTGGRVEPGFSGAPVLDRDLNAVIGMVVAAGRKPEEKVGYLIPAQLIYETWNAFPPASRMSVLKVWPRVLDFGDMPPHSILHARIGIDGDSDLRWSYDLSGDHGVEARRAERGVVLIADLRPGEFRASVRVRSNVGEAVTEVTGRRAGGESLADAIAHAKLALAAASPDAAPYLTQDEARTALRGWLAANSGRQKRSMLRWIPRLPGDLFDGPLGVRNASSILLQVGRVLEQRQEHEVIDRYIPPSEYANIAVVDPPRLCARDSGSAVRAGLGIVSGLVWTGVKAGSSKTTTCGACVGKGSINCRECAGMGGRKCPDRIICGRCNGTGITNRETDPRVCYDCQGAKVVPCPRCNGFGKIECRTCLGSGQRSCGECQGTGSVFRYIRGSIIRDIAMNSQWADCLPGTVDNFHRWNPSLQELILEPEVISELPARLQRFLAEQMDLPWSAGEVARVAELDVLRAVCVTFKYGDHEGTALIAGPHRTVHLRISDEDRTQLHRAYSANRRTDLTERLRGWRPRRRGPERS